MMEDPSKVQSVVSFLRFTRITLFTSCYDRTAGLSLGYIGFLDWNVTRTLWRYKNRIQNQLGPL